MTYSENRFLTQAEMKVNGQYILDYFTSRGWTKNAVCGMLGNMETESTINPGIWQGLQENNMSGGFGLVQWTPATKYTDWADSNSFAWGNLDGQLTRIIYEIDNGLQWIATTEYNFSFAQFKAKTDTPEYLADAFLKCYERPADQNQPDRGTQARYWFDTLTSGGSVTYDFIYPTDAPITSPFNDPNRVDHFGVDFATTEYEEIVASASGVVSNSYVSSSYGEVVFILHNIDGQEYETVYAHLQTGSRTVTTGQNVTQGQVIGVMGNTGDSTGQHLHFELHVGRWNDAKSNAVDPIPYLNVPNEEEPPTVNKNKQLITMLLTDALNGWKF